MAKVIDEKQTGQYRLIIIDGKLPQRMDDTIMIDGIKFETAVAYDLPGSIAIKCSENTQSLIGKNID